jgi:hypothetical protein
MDLINEEGTSIHRQIGVSFNPNNSFDFDKGYDSEIYDLGLTDVYWTSPNDDLKYIIAGVEGISEALEVPFDIIMDYDGSVIIEIDEIKGIERDVFIKDGYTNQTYLLNNNTVALQLDAETHTDRYSLVFKGTVLSVDDSETGILDKELAVFMDCVSKELVLQNYRGLEIREVTLYNLLGQKIEQWKEIETVLEKRLKVKSLKNQVYIVNIETDKGSGSKKIFTKRKK